MAIKVGDKIPSSRFRVQGAEGVAWKTTDDIFKGKTVALFAVPGAFTPTCSNQHLPSVIENVDNLKAKGVDTIAMTSVNDHMVMEAWKKASKADGVEFLADGNGEFAKAVDLFMDASGGGMGIRSKRYSMLIKDGVVTQLNLEEPGKYDVSSGEAMLKQM